MSIISKEKVVVALIPLAASLTLLFVSVLFQWASRFDLWVSNKFSFAGFNPPKCHLHQECCLMLLAQVTSGNQPFYLKGLGTLTCKNPH